MTSVVSSKVYSARVTLASGEDVSEHPNLNGSSKLISIRRITAGGTVGVPHATLVPPTGAGANAVWQLGVYSASATDTSVYDVEWVNQYIPSQLLDGVQFSP